MLQQNQNNYDASCLRMKCTDTNVQIKIGEEVFECPSKGIFDVNLTVYRGKIDCPSYEEICTNTLEHRCNMDCYGKGFCMADRTCQCFKGFFGKDCHDGLESKDETDPFVTSYKYEKNDDGNDDGNDGDDKEDEDDGTVSTPTNPKNPTARFYIEEILKLNGQYDDQYVEKYKDQFKVKKLDMYKDHFQTDKRNQEKVDLEIKIRSLHDPEINGTQTEIDILSKSLDLFLSDNEKKLWKDYKEEQKWIRWSEIHSTISGWYKAEKIPKYNDIKQKYQDIIKDYEALIQNEIDPTAKTSLQESINKYTLRNAYYDKVLQLINTEIENWIGEDWNAIKHSHDDQEGDEFDQMHTEADGYQDILDEMNNEGY